MAHPTKHYGRWRIRWIDGAGIRRSLTFAHRKDAERALRQRELQADEERLGIRLAPPVRRTFGELADYWIAQRVPQKRSGKDDIYRINKHLRPAFGTIYLDQIGTERVEAFTRSASLSPGLAHNVLTLLIAMLNLAVEMEWLRKRPRIRKPNASIVGANFAYLRNEEEISRFLRAAKSHRADVFALYATALYTGMRLGELATLRWDDVDLARRIITVQRGHNGPTKAGYVRYVPVLDPLLPILSDWHERAIGSIVFPNEAGGVHGKQSRIFQETLRKVLRRAELPTVERNGRVKSYITFHGLRHTFASHWMMRGGSIYRLQKIGGWKSFSMVLRYSHLAADVFAEDYGRLGSVLPVH